MHGVTATHGHPASFQGHCSGLNRAATWGKAWSWQEAGLFSGPWQGKVYCLLSPTPARVWHRSRQWLLGEGRQGSLGSQDSAPRASDSSSLGCICAAVSLEGGGFADCLPKSCTESRPGVQTPGTAASACSSPRCFPSSWLPRPLSPGTEQEGRGEGWQGTDPWLLSCSADGSFAGH